MAAGLLLAAGAAAAQLPAPGLQQKRFLAAEQALKKHQTTLFEQLKSALADYPLLPYLEYQALLQRLDRATPEEVESFLERHADTPLAQRLRVRWLNRLAKRKEWSSYLRFYLADGNVTRQCHYLHALIREGRREEAFSRVEPLWLHGRSRPKACDPVFQAWREAGGLSEELVWERIDRAMRLGQLRLVRYLKRLLPEDQRPWADLWLQLRRKPELALTAKRLRQPHPMRDRMLAYAVVRRAGGDPLAALELWQELERRYDLDGEARRRAVRTLARGLLREEDPAAWDFFRQLEEKEEDSGLLERRILAALFRQQWEEALAWIEELPEAARQEERWRYWKARSLEQLGKRGLAEPLYRELARERSFYGFLAADHAGLPYNLNQDPAPVDATLLEKVAEAPGIARARELVALERWTDARREWRFTTSRMTAEEAMAAAKLAQSWNWHDQAIFTLARTGYWEDLELRFPLAHRETVENRADERNLDVSWVFGVIRQESAFNPAVRSHAGALGLMQLMPATARYVARKLLKQKRSPTRRDLVRPEVNIRLGTTYLSDMLNRLEQNPVLATAAYNAGPHRVFRWLPDRQLPADLWIELIPFAETRQYVKRVFTYAVIYDHRREQEIVRLSQRLQPVAGSSPQRTAQQQRNGQATL